MGMTRRARPSEVIAFANRVRKHMGLGPVDAIEKGHAGGAFTCPVAATINTGQWKEFPARIVGHLPEGVTLASVAAGRVAIHRAERHFPEPIADEDLIPVPPSIYRFAQDFDLGKLPQYDRRKASS